MEESTDWMGYILAKDRLPVLSSRNNASTVLLCDENTVAHAPTPEFVL
jgi:hypothetical protein